MKTFTLIVTLAAGLFTVSGLQAQTTQSALSTPGRTTRTSRATISSRNNARLNAQRAASVRAQSNLTRTAPPRIDGGIVRTVRSGNPLQMINPAAPAEYGSGRDVTRLDVDDPFQRPQGLRLFAVEF